MTAPPTKAFLCSQDGTYNFPLLQKVITIGRENCDILIISNTVDPQHAVIEYIDDENCFVIQDLNTTNGTYINECRVQNAAVRLAEQDVIRFGFNSVPFQFLIQQQQGQQQSQSQFMTIPPINLSTVQRVQPLQFINQTLPSRSNATIVTQSSGFWLANPLPNASLISISNANQMPTQSQQQISNQVKPPATLRTRPNSSNSRSISVKNNSWVKGYGNMSSSTSNLQNASFPQVPLPVVDSETYRRDDDQSPTQMTTSTTAIEVSNRVSQLERELKMKTIEIKDLKEKVAFYQNQQGAGSSQNVELEQLKRDKSIACGLVNTMQKDLSNKDGTISKLAREIEGYKRDLKNKETLYNELEEKYKFVTDPKKIEEEKQNKEKELIVLRTKFKATEEKIIDLTNQILQIKNELEESNKSAMRQANVERQLREEIDIGKSQYLDMQRAERTVRIDLEQMKRTYDKFRNLIIQAIYSLPDVRRPTGETSDDDLIEAWKKIIEEKTKITDKLHATEKKLSYSEEVSKDIVKNVNNLRSVMMTVEHRIETGIRRAACLEAEIKILESNNVHDSLSKIKECLITIYTNELKRQSELEESLKIMFDIDLKNDFSSRELLKMVKTKYEEAKNDEKQKYEKKLSELVESHKKELSQEIEKCKKEASENISKQSDEDISAKLTELESQLTLKYTEELEILKMNLTEALSVKESSQATQNSLIEENLSLSKIIQELKVELENANLKLVDTSTIKETIAEELNAKLSHTQIEINDIHVNYQNQISQLNASLTEAENKYSLELSIHKEQIKQHSITIVNFEKEIKQLKEKELEYLHQIEKLKSSSISQKVKHHLINAPPAPPPPQPPASQSDKKRETSGFDYEALNKTIELLRSECSSYRNRLSEQEDLVKTLRRDLAGASAKLSDVHGELTEKQKRELERNRHLVLEQQRELSDSRAQLGKLSEIVDKQTKQLDQLKSELSKSKSLVEKYQRTSEENGILAVELKAKLDGMETQIKKVENVKREEGKITTELTAIGAQCKGERHEQVISRQREALNELRQKLKILEQMKPPGPNNQQQLQQQIMLLKKQLAEVRASQALTEDIAKQANLARGNDHTFLILEEKTAHFETQTALEASEESFFTIVKAMANILDITELDGLRSMNNLSPDERQRLNNERAKCIEAICIRIRNIQESLRRKEQLLKDYEIDLAKLRQAEFLLQKKSEQLDDTQLFSRSKEDEIEFLKESLKNKGLELEREKLLNTAIKQKRSVNSVQQLTERVRRSSTDTLHHHCPPTDSRSNQVQKNMHEKIKRKDYELKTLKDELKTKKEELSFLTNRVTIAEKSSNMN